jgi:hypothetical protein
MAATWAFADLPGARQAQADILKEDQRQNARIFPYEFALRGPMSVRRS